MPVILAIDDDPLGLHVRRLVLERAGYAVLATTDAGEGLGLFASQNVDVVLMDYYLPGERGNEIRREMKQLKPYVPIVVLSGLSEAPRDLNHVDRFLSKLQGPEALLAELHALLSDLPYRNAA